MGDCIGASIGSKVEGDGGGRKSAREIGVVSPTRKGRPEVNGVGNDAGLVRRHEVSEELKWGRRGFEPLNSARVSQAQIPHFVPQGLNLLHVKMNSQKPQKS